MTDEEIEFHVVAQSGDVNEDEPAGRRRPPEEDALASRAHLS